MLSLRLSRGFAKSMKSIECNARFLSAAPKETYSEKQAKKGRPVSPHVTIYKFPIAALTSITNRVTGVILSVGITGMGGLALAGVDVPTMLSTIGSIALVGPVAKLLVTFPLTYHYFGGLRHIIWDHMPETLQNDQVDKACYILIGASVSTTLAVALLV